MDFLNRVDLIKNNFINMPGWRTNSKIVVLESDDWGSIRTVSQDTLKLLRRNNINVDICHYMLYDSLESEEDLIFLFELLKSFKDSNGNHPLITANVLVANPDFDKIRKAHFEEYYWENVKQTFNRYPRHTKSYDLWLEGINEGIFYPQSHGREHLNIKRWLNDLRKKREDTMLAFELRMFGLSQHIVKEKRESYLAVYDGTDDISNKYRRDSIIEGLNLFNELLGYKSLSFIPPNYIWDDYMEELLSKNDIMYIQGSTTQRVSKNEQEKRKIKRHFLGQKNRFNQIYIVRNASFEPSEDPSKDWVDSCLYQIKTAFLWKKPAIISTHRVNYMGYLNQKNRDNNLQLFKILLQNILKKWPDVIFCSTPQLGELISEA